MNAYRTIDYSDPSSMTTQAGPGDFFDVVNAWVVPTSSHIIHKLIQNTVCRRTEKPSRSPSNLVSLHIRRLDSGQLPFHLPRCLLDLSNGPVS